VTLPKTDLVIPGTFSPLGVKTIFSRKINKKCAHGVIYSIGFSEEYLCITFFLTYQLEIDFSRKYYMWPTT
jgi:hypothetical protein